ncbi:MAG: hypothetical protein V1911_04415 [Candidatus Micrarchaeota archaeon]
MTVQRQAMQVSPDELRKLASELEKEGKKVSGQFKFKFNAKKKWQVNIINETKACDTWKFE